MGCNSAMSLAKQGVRAVKHAATARQHAAMARAHHAAGIAHLASGNAKGHEAAMKKAGQFAAKAQQSMGHSVKALFGSH
jgi:hypothetical protein